MTVFSKLIAIYRDERGAIVSIELVVLATLVVIGLLAGLGTYRDALVQELGDSAAGVASLQQSFSVEAVSLTGDYGGIPYDSFVSGSSFLDNTDFCEAILDTPSAPPICIQITAAAIDDEG